MKLFQREVIATMTTIDLIAYHAELVSALENDFNNGMLDETVDDVELELIRRDDVPEEFFPLIDSIQEAWSDDECED